MKQLDDLILEVIEFSNTIACSENPADPDLQHACHLFSNYLTAQLKLIRRNMIGPASAMHSRWTGSELRQLSELMDRPNQSTSSCIDWIRDLFQYCVSLQHHTSAAA